MSSQSKNANRLSSLPEDVLSHILSLMPTIFAVRTSILSKTWRYTWTFVTNLDFDDSHPAYASTCFSTCVDRVLDRCKTSQLNLFRLGIFRYASMKKSDMSKWINQAVRLNVCELDIQVWATELPPSLFTCKTLTKLRLVFSYDDLGVFKVSSPVMLPGLKTLDLCVSSKPSADVFKFIHGCPVLESLSLEMMRWNIIEQYYNFNIPTLKRLEIETQSSYLYGSKVVLNVPNLEYLSVGGDSCPHFVMKDLSFLVEANVSFHGSRDYYNRTAELLKGLNGVKSLSLCTSFLDHFTCSPLPKFPNLKHLELKGSYGSQWLLAIQILKSSPELEHLSLEEFCDQIKPTESSWIEPLSVPSCMLSNLKTIKIKICKGQKCDIQFIEFMLRNAEVLKTLTVVCGSLCMKEEKEIWARLLNFPRGSRFCEIHFVGN